MPNLFQTLRSMKHLCDDSVGWAFDRFSIKPVLFRPPAVSSSARPGRDSSFKRVLFLDNQVPHPRYGSGMPRSHRIIHELVGLGCSVTVLPLLNSSEANNDACSDLDVEVDVVLNCGYQKFRSFFRKNRTAYDIVVVSRTHNYKFFKLNSKFRFVAGLQPRIVFDAESLEAGRLVASMKRDGQSVSPDEEARLYREEISHINPSDLVLTVSNGSSDGLRILVSRTYLFSGMLSNPGLVWLRSRLERIFFSSAALVLTRPIQMR